MRSGKKRMFPITREETKFENLNYYEKWLGKNVNYFVSYHLVGNKVINILQYYNRTSTTTK